MAWPIASSWLAADVDSGGRGVGQFPANPSIVPHTTDPSQKQARSSGPVRRAA